MNIKSLSIQFTNIAILTTVPIVVSTSVGNAASLSIGSFIRSDVSGSGVEFVERQIPVGSDGVFFGDEFGFAFGGTFRTDDPNRGVLAQISLENFFVNNVSALRIGAISPQVSVFEIRFSDSLFVDNKKSKGSVVAKGAFLGPGTLENGSGAFLELKGNFLPISSSEIPQLYSTSVIASTNPGFPQPLTGNKINKRFDLQSTVSIPTEPQNTSTLSPSSRTLFTQGSLQFVSRPGEILTIEEASISSVPESIPEPFSILGSLAALGIGIAIKKSHSKHLNKDKY